MILYFLYKLVLTLLSLILSLIEKIAPRDSILGSPSSGPVTRSERGKQEKEKRKKERGRRRRGNKAGWPYIPFRLIKNKEREETSGAKRQKTSKTGN